MVPSMAGTPCCLKSVQAEKFGAQYQRQADADCQCENAKLLPNSLSHGVVADVHPQVAQASDEVVHGRPRSMPATNLMNQQQQER